MEVVLHRSFKKKFKKLPREIQLRFYERVEMLIKNRNNIVLNNHRVDRVFPDCRSINISGNYRAIFKEEGETMVFLKIGRHSELYR